MKYSTNQLLISLALASTLIGLNIIPTQAETLIIGQNNNNQEITINGNFESSNNHHQGCGYLSQEPNKVITLEQNANLSISLEANNSQSSPTLFIVGENTQTQYCAFQDQINGESPEISGLFLEDTYSIYVGERNAQRYNFTLTINFDNNLM